MTRYALTVEFDGRPFMGWQRQAHGPSVQQAIEEAALASGAVSDAAAVGVPDERLGQAIVLVAVAKGEGAEEGLRTYLRRELPPHMQPREVAWKDRLPVGPNGKLDRTTLRAALA